MYRTQQQQIFNALTLKCLGALPITIT